MKVADGFEPGAVIGPLIDMKAVEKVEAHITDAVKKGVKVVLGGKRAAQGGSFFEPTALTDVTTDMVITKEENLGPVAPLYRFKTDAEAIKMANDTPLPSPRAGGGLERGSPPISTAATPAALARRRGPRVRHRRHQRGHHLAESAGEIAPFGGMKESGIGPIRPFTGARKIRHRGIPRSQIPLHGRRRPVKNRAKRAGEDRIGQRNQGQVKAVLGRVPDLAGHRQREPAEDHGKFPLFTKTRLAHSPDEVADAENDHRPSTNSSITGGERNAANPVHQCPHFRWYGEIVLPG
jgi:hypothetical protein